MALKFYDIAIDANREPTQQDIDMMQATVQAYGKLRSAMAAAHTELLIEMERIKARGPAIDLEGPGDATSA